MGKALEPDCLFSRIDSLKDGIAEFRAYGHSQAGVGPNASQPPFWAVCGFAGEADECANHARDLQGR